MNNPILIVDYGMGNINSIIRKINQLGAECYVSSNPEDIVMAGKLLLPGVGHFGRAMMTLRETGLIEPLNEAVLKQKIPVLGICLGMQLMAKHSEEGDVEGLGWLDGNVIQFRIDDALRFKIPHMGWNNVVQKKPSKLLSGIDDSAEFYFVHRYHYLASQNQEEVLAETDYSGMFVSAIEKDNIYGVQFHPEKSHDSGTLILKNFITS